MDINTRNIGDRYVITRGRTNAVTAKRIADGRAIDIPEGHYRKPSAELLPDLDERFAQEA